MRPSLLIPSITLSRRHSCLCVLANILPERTTDVILFVEATSFIASHEPFVASGVD
jgi:hypothetical protein